MIAVLVVEEVLTRNINICIHHPHYGMFRRSVHHSSNKKQSEKGVKRQPSYIQTTYPRDTGSWYHLLETSFHRRGLPLEKHLYTTMSFQKQVIAFLVALASQSEPANSFMPTAHRSWKLVSIIANVPPPSTQLNFFWQKRKENEGESNVSENESPPLSSEKEASDNKALPFFASAKERTESETDPPSNVVTATIVAEEPSPQKVKPQPLTPLEQAQALRAQAQRARLEAERMDVQLTLSKISKLEKEMAAVKSKGNSVEDLLKSMDTLQRKMRGEDPLPVIVDYAGASTQVPVKEEKEVEIDFGPVIDKAFIDKKTSEFVEMSDETKLVMANLVGMNVNRVSEINATEFALRSAKIGANDYTVLRTNTPPPTFSKEDIEEFKKSPLFVFTNKFPKRVDDDTFILQEMTNKYYKSKYLERFFFGGNETLEDFLDFSNITNVMDEGDEFLTFQALFPNSVAKEGKEPTEAQATLLMTEVLPKVGFSASGKPTRVFGGYSIRGTCKEKSGDDLIDKIDDALGKYPALRDKITVTYLSLPLFLAVNISDDPSKLMDQIFSPKQALFITGADIAQEPRRIAKTLVSACGIATSWYLSIFPFLFNDELSKRVDEQVSLADASMAYDLSWLTDLSFPLFATFMGIQLTHEVGHRIAAGAYGLNITLPTFVPSITTGITSTLTSLKSPAKNYNQLFDFAVAGPLFGIIASVVALYIGLQLTVGADASTSALFPALPLQILRQSSLGGGIIESVLGSGTLSIPNGASELVNSINIPLHPVAISGFFSLIVNTIALLPIGVTDGGRIAQAVFGREGKGFVGQVSLLALLGVGFFGDDLFLFYALFCLIFQLGTEIPIRNEVDSVSFVRVMFATGLGIVTLLSLIPIQ